MEEEDSEQNRKKKSELITLRSMGLITTFFAGFFATAHFSELQQVAGLSKYVQGDIGITFYERIILFWSLLFSVLFLMGLVSIITNHKLGLILSFGITVFALLYMFMLSPIGK